MNVSGLISGNWINMNIGEFLSYPPRKRSLEVSLRRPVPPLLFAERGSPLGSDTDRVNKLSSDPKGRGEVDLTATRSVFLPCGWR